MEWDGMGWDNVGVVSERSRMRMKMGGSCVGEIELVFFFDRLWTSAGLASLIFPGKKVPCRPEQQQ